MPSYLFSVLIRVARVDEQSDWLGLPARNAVRASSISPSSWCHLPESRGLSPASASSQATSRSLIRVLPPARSFLATLLLTSVTMVAKEVRSPSRVVGWTFRADEPRAPPAD